MRSGRHHLAASGRKHKTGRFAEDRRDISSRTTLGSNARGKDGSVKLGEVGSGLTDGGADHYSDRTEAGSGFATDGVTARSLIDDQLADGAPIRCASMLDLAALGIAGQGQHVDPATTSIGQLNRPIQSPETEVGAESDGIGGKRRPSLR